VNPLDRDKKRQFNRVSSMSKGLCQKWRLKMTIYGYARVSSVEQNLDRQIEALKLQGCQVIFEEKLSGATMERPELNKLLNQLKEGDLIIIHDMTRISRSTRDLFNLIDLLKEKGAFLKSVKDSWLDLSKSNATSELMLTIFAGIAQFERALLKERQAEGIAIAKKKGIYQGRPKTYTDKNPRLKHALELYQAGGKTIKEICKATGISESTFYRAIRK
jgi:DNA invertase Pin-like site-specific DNA recombinase